jgi:DNA-binding GntR family transcriptional regulator
MADLALSPIRRNTSLTNEATERLRKAILNGELEEGATLPEAQTAAKLGVSRVPVREALVTLEREGLVEFDRNGRACVRTFTADDGAEIISLRAALQRMAARLAAKKLTDEDVARLDKILDRAKETQDLTAFSALDTAFHDEVVVIARHKRLSRLWTDVRSQFELWLARIHRRRESALHDVRQATLKAHRVCIDTLKTRNPDAAGDLMERHCSWKEFTD